MPGTEKPMPDERTRETVPYRILVRLCCGAAAAIGCIALLALALGPTHVASLGKGLVPMAPSTSLLFLAYGIAGFIAIRAPAGRRAERTALFISAAGAAIALPLFVLSLQGRYLGIELLGFKSLESTGSVPVGHMSPITAFSFLAVSVSLLAVLTAYRQRGLWAKVSFWIAVLLVAGYSMLSLAYLLGTPMFYDGHFIPPAATTSLAFMALGLALFFLSAPLVFPDPLRSVLEARHSSLLLIVLFLFLVAGIVAAGHFYHKNHEKQYLAEVGRQLHAIAELKKSELMQWREERLGDASLFHENSAFAAVVKSYLLTPPARRAHHVLNSWLGSIKANNNYDRVFLLDKRGKSTLSLPGSAEPLSRYVTRKAEESLATGRITFADFYRNETTGRIYLGLLVPIYDPSEKGHALGVLAIRIDPERYLFPFITRWPTESATGETLIVRREGDYALFLNELRFRKNTALNLRIPLEKVETPAVKAVLGETGVKEGVDYRGVPVLAALLRIPDSPWYLVARMDLAEIYQPLRERMWVTVALVFTLLLSAATGVGFAWRQQRVSYYKRMYESELERTGLASDLARQSALLRSIIDSIPDLIFYKDVQSVYLGCNKAFERYAGRPEKEQVGKTDFDFFDRETAEFFRQKDREMFENGQSRSNEEWITYPDGHRVLLDTLKTPFCGPDGKLLGLVGISRDITERKEKEREIEKKNSELERFLYTVSHDLKSPLVTITAFLGYLEKDVKTADEPLIQKDIGYIRTAAEKMEQLLAELLELSRIGRVVANPVQVGFQDVVKEALQLVAGHISERGVQVKIGENPIVLYGDRSRLVEIWQNLVENAVKYMGAQAEPRIELGAEQVSGETVFFVRDNGMGIDPQYQEKIFGLFNKLDAGSAGSGLGLALVKRIVEMYGGRIWVESAGAGLGACFRFTLPGTIQQTQP